ncbi:hypothetical protein B0A54_00779 [Friedmanniomyces endolithicus]|uniref:Meiotic nuclear division protein 1 n=1 Tax=Friedmanniomyces endolithicus TaxID=329885 RepID=A0A4U0VI26_9PEZI|nr:hypothetical protein LTS09_002613 [Friedmanniomyces endolithicus]TKA48643.1 hypothetical protein B0A54_00779 [Friedmanniomyces endolithicus]
MAPKITCNPIKLANVLTYFQKSRVAYNIKDLEKHLPSVASINGMQVKDYLQSLPDENRINVEKIGSGNWYWSFISQDKKTRQKILEEVQSAYDKAYAVTNDLRAKLAGAQAQRVDEEGMLDEAGESRPELVARKSELEAEIKALQRELAAYSDSDPTELERKKNEIVTYKHEVGQYTDEIDALEGWFKTGGQDEAMHGLRLEVYGDEYDAEEGGLRELPA